MKSVIEINRILFVFQSSEFFTVFENGGDEFIYYRGKDRYIFYLMMVTNPL